MAQPAHNGTAAAWRRPPLGPGASPPGAPLVALRVASYNVGVPSDPARWGKNRQRQLEADMHNLIQRVDIILLQEVGQHEEASTLSYDVLRRALPDHWQLCADNAYIAAWNEFKLGRSMPPCARSGQRMPAAHTSTGAGGRKWCFTTRALLPCRRLPLPVPP
jgi:hypothetical protein